MRRLKQVIACTVLLTLVTAIATPPPAQAQFAVYDALNWIENATQVLQQVYMIYQKYQSLVNDYQRYATMVKNLQKLDGLSFQSLLGLTAIVNEVITEGEALGHTLYDIDAQFASTFPGYSPVLENDWLSIFSHRNKRTLDTMRYTLDALAHIAHSGVSSQSILQTFQSHVESADGNLKALQAAGELLHHEAGQLAEMNQQLSLQTNVQTVFWAYQLDREASDRATTSQWIANGVATVPAYDSARGARGVPAAGPWTCLGCGAAAAVQR